MAAQPGAARPSGSLGRRRFSATWITSRTIPRGTLVMAGWLRRAGRYRELFEKALVRQGLPKDLFYVAMVESGFDTGARSRVGAGGIWQFMPSAARAYGLEVSYWVDARRDPERAVEAAARYLKDLYVRFGSWYLVFAAYNAGYGVGPAIDHDVQHERLLGADPPRGGAAVGVDALRPEDPGGGHRGPQPGGVRLRGRHPRSRRLGTKRWRSRREPRWRRSRTPPAPSRRSSRR